MTFHHVRWVAVWTLASLLTGCQSVRPHPQHKLAPNTVTRNNCLSLLHDLLSQENNVSLLRFIKDEQGDVRGLIRRVSERSAAGVRMLEIQAKEDNTIVLDALDLPSGERATREAIAASTREELLRSSGELFEVRLLGSQLQALTYAEYLAWVASQNESETARAQALKDFSLEMKVLHQEALRILQSR